MDARTDSGGISVRCAESAIVVFGFPGLGDLVRCHSLIQMIAARHPGRPIDLVVRRSTAAIAEFMPEIRETVVDDFRHRRLDPFVRLRVVKALRKRGYDTAYIIQSSLKAALVPFFAKIPERIGWAQECRSMLLTKPRFRMRRLSRMVDRTCWLAVANDHDVPAHWPEPRLQVPLSLHDEFEKIAQKARQAAPVVAICPGSTDPRKNWPVRNYAEIARRCSEAGCGVWIVGATEHRYLAAEIMANAPARDHLTSSLRKLALTIAAADIFVGNDSGPLHVAAAFGKPCIGVFGLTDAALNAPINAGVKVAAPEFSIARKSIDEIHWPSIESVAGRLDGAIESVRRVRQFA